MKLISKACIVAGDINEIIIPLILISGMFFSVYYSETSVNQNAKLWWHLDLITDFIKVHKLIPS